jgi:pyruvate/2-oxoglutarate dehydrogenase complex dihydrolipoamide dehydrogenase (E3) component
LKPTGLLVIGARPNTKIAVDAGIELGGACDNGDDHLRTNIPGIYAAGDCAEATQMVTGKKATFFWVQPHHAGSNSERNVAGMNTGL